VGIARSDVHYAVTEYGIAYLFGKSIRERAVSLIEVAHPSCREELLAAAKRQGYVPPEQYLASRAAYPVHEERAVRLKNGKDILIRPARAADADAFADAVSPLVAGRRVHPVLPARAIVVLQ
jgi:hypothetical protein